MGCNPTFSLAGEELLKRAGELGGAPGFLFGAGLTLDVVRAEKIHIAVVVEIREDPQAIRSNHPNPPAA
jgi:hypothetical protein